MPAQERRKTFSLDFTDHHLLNQLDLFLADSTKKTSSLVKNPSIKEMFLKFNAACLQHLLSDSLVLVEVSSVRLGADCGIQTLKRYCFLK